MFNKYKLYEGQAEKKSRLVFALCQLKKSPDFELLVEAMEETLSKLDVQNRTAQPPVLHTNQGAAQYLSELLTTISQADDHANLLRASKAADGTPRVTSL